MNQKIGDAQLRALCRELLRSAAPMSGRQMRAELKARFGAVGKTSRVFRIWREEVLVKTVPAKTARVASFADRQAAPDSEHSDREMHARLAAAEEEARVNRERAELAELRERAHQDHWALEIDRLREKVRAQSREAAEIRGLKEQLARVTSNLARARAVNGGS